MSTQQLHGIVQPHEHDVLSGRGNFVNYHAGNEHFRALVRKHKVAYVACPKPQKGKFSKMIVDEVRRQNPPGRFLKQDAKTKLWYDIGEKKSLDKTRQALREGAPTIMKELTGGEEDDDDDDGDDDGSEEHQSSPLSMQKVTVQSVPLKDNSGHVPNPQILGFGGFSSDTSPNAMQPPATAVSAAGTGALHLGEQLNGVMQSPLPPNSQPSIVSSYSTSGVSPNTSPYGVPPPRGLAAHTSMPFPSLGMNQQQQASQSQQPQQLQQQQQQQHMRLVNRNNSAPLSCFNPQRMSQPPSRLQGVNLPMHVQSSMTFDNSQSNTSYLPDNIGDSLSSTNGGLNLNNTARLPPQNNNHSSKMSSLNYSALNYSSLYQDQFEPSPINPNYIPSKLYERHQVDFGMGGSQGETLAPLPSRRAPALKNPKRDLKRENSENSLQIDNIFHGGNATTKSILDSSDHKSKQMMNNGGSSTHLSIMSLSISDMPHEPTETLGPLLSSGLSALSGMSTVSSGSSYSRFSERKNGMKAHAAMRRQGSSDPYSNLEAALDMSVATLGDRLSDFGGESMGRMMNESEADVSFSNVFDETDRELCVNEAR